MSKVQATKYYDKLVLEVEFDGMSDREKQRFDYMIGDGVITDREMMELMKIKAPDLFVYKDGDGSSTPRFRNLVLKYPEPHQRSYVVLFLLIAFASPLLVMLSFLLLYAYFLGA